MNPGDIVRVKSRGVIVITNGALVRRPSSLLADDLVFIEKDEILLVLEEVMDQSIKILHPRLGVGWITRDRLEAIK